MTTPTFAGMPLPLNGARKLPALLPDIDNPTGEELRFAAAFNERAAEAQHNSAIHGFWDAPRNKGEMLALIHSEVSECLEGLRKGLQDDHLPHRTMEEAELADVVIRVLDYGAGFGLDVGGAIVEKMRYNATRPRLHGKSF